MDDTWGLVISFTSIVLSILAIMFMILLYYLTNKLLNEIRLTTGLSQETDRTISNKVETMSLGK